MKMKRSLSTLAVVVILLLSIALSGCGGDKNNAQETSQESNTSQDDTTTPDKEAVYGGSIVVGMTQDLVSLDPHQITDAGTRSVVFNIFEGLVKVTSDGDILCAVAEDYSISEDATVYTFNLRDGLKFHDGTPVTAEDVKYSLDRYAGIQGDVSSFLIYDETVIVDEDTVEVHLSQPNSEFIYQLNVAIIPEALGDDIAKNPVGTGPFKYVNYSIGQKLELAKNEEYWQTGLPYLDAVEFKFIANVETAFNELQGKTINVLNYLTVDQVQSLDDSYTIVEGTMNLVHALFLNNAYEPLQKPEVRQAICMAIDKDAINGFLFGGASKYIGGGIIPSIAKYFSEEAAAKYTYDPEGAKALLAKAGYENGFDLKISVPKSYTQHVATAEIIKENLDAIGINTTIDTIEWSAWLSDVYQGREYEATVIGVDGTLAPSEWFSRYQSTASNNFINYSNATVDEKYAQAKATIDDAEKVTLYKEIQMIMAEDAASAYIEDPADFVAMTEGLEGYEFYPTAAYDVALIHFVK